MLINCFANLSSRRGPQPRPVLCVCAPRFLTCPDQPGVEKLAVSATRPDHGCRSPHCIAADKVDPLYGGSTLQLQSAFMVKGWSRSVAGLTVLLAAYELRDDENSLLAVPQLHTVSLLTS